MPRIPFSESDTALTQVIQDARMFTEFMNQVELVLRVRKLEDVDFERVYHLPQTELGKYFSLTKSTRPTLHRIYTNAPSKMKGPTMRIIFLTYAELKRDNPEVFHSYLKAALSADLSTVANSDPIKVVKSDSIGARDSGKKSKVEKIPFVPIH